jgi:hypothetical protein
MGLIHYSDCDYPSVIGKRGKNVIHVTSGDENRTSFQITVVLKKLKTMDNIQNNSSGYDYLPNYVILQYNVFGIH